MRCFSPTALALGSSVSVPQTVRYTHLPVSCSFWGKWLLPQRKGSVDDSPTVLYICLANGCCFRKGSWSTNCSLHLSPSLLLGSKLHDMSHPYTSSPHKAIHHGFGIGVVFGLILCLRKGIPVSCYHNQRTASDGRCDSSTGSLQTEH